MAAVSAVAAVAFGATAGLAQASEARAVAPQTVSVTQQAEAQQIARTLLASELASGLSAAERTELNAIASGERAQARVSWSAIRAAFSRIAGFARAIAGTYTKFKEWYDALSWWQKAPLRAITPGLTLLDIYNALH
jgi:hypothetical protein